MGMRHVAALGLALLAGCAVPQMPAPAPSGRTEAPVPAAPSPSVAATAPSSERARVLAGNFFAAVDRVLPVAERTCREETRDLNCDFAIVVDDRPGLPPNAFQTLDPNGRPVIGFTLSLIAQADNQDELAFIIGHETAHHIAGHLARSRNSAILGASIAGVLARQRADVKREMAGLQRRMDDAYQRAAALLANSEDYGERSARDEEEIVAFEASAEAARRRIADLSRQLEMFESISELLGDAETGPAA